jgi:hypothetical protein
VWGSRYPPEGVELRIDLRHAVSVRQHDLHPQYGSTRCLVTATAVHIMTRLCLRGVLLYSQMRVRLGVEPMVSHRMDQAPFD